MDNTLSKEGIQNNQALEEAHAVPQDLSSAAEKEAVPVEARETVKDIEISSAQPSSEAKPIQVAKPRTRDSHFWVASSRFFETVLFLSPPAHAVDGSAVSPLHATVYVYDCDGALVNEVDVRLQQPEVAILELDQFLGECKLEAGIRHAHLVVSVLPEVAVRCRIHSREGAAWIPELTTVHQNANTFFPLTPCKSRTPLFAAVNLGNVSGQLRCRLFCGKRTPEVVVNVPSSGSRLFSLEEEFSEFFKEEEFDAAQAYLRFSSKTTSGIGVIVLERSEAQHGMEFIYSIV